MRLKYLWLALIALAPAATVRADLITFEGHFNDIYGAPIDRLGMRIGNPVGQEQHFHEIDSTAFPSFVPNNGTGVLYNDRNTQIFMQAAPSATFSTFVLNSIDVATDLNGGAGGSATLSIQGFLNNVLVGTINVSLNQAGLYTTVNGASLGLIDRLLFDGIPTQTGNGGFTLDNVNFAAASAVPVPSGVILAGFGLAGALAFRRRFQGQKATV